MAEPLSAMQQAFWLGEMLSGDGGARATLVFGLDLDGPLDVERLDGALSAVVRRHPLLRARIAADREGLSLAVEEPPATILTRLPGGEDALERWCARPVSARAWPPCRAAVALGEDGARLRVAVQHAVFDGHSKDVFLRDLARAYDERADRPPAPRDAAFWRAFLRREGVLAAPAPASPAAPPRASGAPPESLAFAIEPGLRALVAEAAGRLGVSKFTVQLAALHAVLARLRLDDADVVTPIALSTRTPAEADEIGPFVNQLPVRSTAACAGSFRALADELGRRVRELASDRHRRPTPALPGGGGPEVAVSYRRDALGRLAWPDGTATPVRLPPLHAPGSDAAIRMLDHGASASGAIDVDRDALPSGWGRRLERCWLTLLRTAAQRLDARVGELPLEERR